MNCAILGGGRMGEALLAGLLAAGFEAEKLAIAEQGPERRKFLEEKFPGVRVVPSAAWAVADTEEDVIAVKHHDVPSVLEQAQTALPENTLIISIAAGVTTGDIESMVPNHPVVRAMPNTPAVVGFCAGATAAGASASENHLAMAEEILGAVGSVVRVSENLMDAVTGLSGSGPAYVFLVAESLIEAGVLAGLTWEQSETLVVQTLLGSATMLKEGHGTTAELRAQVTSPGGTTAAGLRELEAHAVRAAFIDAVEAATARSKELGEGKP